MAADMKDLSSLKISIIGLGLIGGSLARAFRTKAGILDITAVNRNPEAVSQALADGIIARGFAELDAQAMEHVCASDIIFICTPVQRTMQYLEFLSGKVGPSCLVTDVASTKGEIMAFVEKLPDAPLFIGGHPMAGSEKTGYRAGYAHMFENAYYVLTPAAGSQACVSADPSAVTVYADALNRLVSLVRATGAFPVVMNAGEHDFVTGGISHIPHIVASLLVNMTMSLDTPDGKMRLLAAGGFRDITRIASSSPEMWENIVMSNREYIDKLILKL
ncbi:MAG: prephenate dehydrogenase/arogenate dehydrogenase family protein, partial [Clostridiales bacterium]|nr:prephenate dehydrogenase/arogenate dehydrogenase family protein [Clostridiales bacterium]